MRISRRTALKAIAGTGFAALSGVASCEFLDERHNLGVTATEVPVVGLPPSLAGLKIGLLTDVHRSRWVSTDDVLQATRTMVAQSPDLIVLGGDYVTKADRRYMGAAAEALATLSAPHGVFAVLGNHDDDRDMPASLASNGIAVLKDERTAIRIHDERLELAGIRYWTKRREDVASVLRGATGTVFLLAHDPRRLTEAAALGVPLVLSGHTHGGQIVLPGLGAIAAYKFPVLAGIGRRSRTTLFVSRGLGTVYVPARINCPPEVAILTLVPAIAPTA